MVEGWTQARLQRLLVRYNRKFWRGRLNGWTVADAKGFPGLFGYCHVRGKRISVRLSVHKTDRQVRATLIHEMAHAAMKGMSGDPHGAAWRREMQRLRRAGAPTEALDLLVPYSALSTVLMFMDAAASGASWEEASAVIEIPSATVQIACRKHFRLAQRFGNPFDLPVVSQ